MEQLVLVVQELSQASDLDSVMRIVRTAARNLTGSDGATFVLKDGDKCYYADEDAISPLWKGQRFPLSACISGWAMLNGQSAAIEDIYADARIPADAYKVTFVKSLLMVPIRQKDPIGAIGNYWAQSHAPHEQEIKILQALADATSVTLRNIELLERLQKTYEQREKSILDNMHDSMITTDAHGVIENYNRASQNMFGYTAREALGLNIRNLIPGCLDAESLRNDKTSVHELQGKRKNGEIFPLEISATRIHIGNRIFYSCMMRDITDRKASDQKIHFAKEQAEKATQVKSEFLATMSHELRTPLNSIIGMTRLLHEDTALGREHRDMVGIAYKSAGRLLTIVDDILDLSKVEAGELKLEKAIFSLLEAAEGVMQTMIPLSSQKGITFAYDFSGMKDPVYFVGDPLRLGRIMINLICNAIKYTETGGIRIKARLYPFDGNADVKMLEFSVTDTGIGIAADKIEHIFEQFAQADSSITRRFGGTGLGLHIAKRLIEKMDGTISVESTEAKGSRFWFTVPLQVSGDEPSAITHTFRKKRQDQLPAEQRKSIADVKILIAEDHILNQQYMHYLLRRMGIGQYDIVDNGRLALESLHSTFYDLVLMDCHMPELSGYDATKEIRRLEKASGRHLPIVAMTADAMVGTREHCILIGMDDYITKPINPDELQYIMSRWIDFPDAQIAQSVRKESKIETAKPSLVGFSTQLVDLKKLVDIFITQWDQMLISMRNDCVDGECIDWVEAAHKLKGSAALCRAHVLQELCNKAQYMKVSTASDRNGILDRIKVEYEIVREALLRSLIKN